MYSSQKYLLFIKLQHRLHSFWPLGSVVSFFSADANVTSFVSLRFWVDTCKTSRGEILSVTRRMPSFEIPCVLIIISYHNFWTALSKASILCERWYFSVVSLLSSLFFRFLFVRSHTVYCIDVFARCFMFTEVKLALTASGFPTNYPNICDKVLSSVSIIPNSKAANNSRSSGEVRLIGHFWVLRGLCIKTRLGAQPLIWKCFFILMEVKLVFTRKVVYLASFWKWGFLELGNYWTRLSKISWFVSV